MKNLSTDWTKHLKDPEEKANFEQLVRNSVQVLSRFKDILAEKKDNLNSADTKTTDYDCPSWGYKQADRIGRRATLNDLDQLLSFLP